MRYYYCAKFHWASLKGSWDPKGVPKDPPGLFNSKKSLAWIGSNHFPKRHIESIMADIIQYSHATDLSLLLNLDPIRGVGGHFHMTNDGNLQQIRVRFSAFTFSRAFDNELFKGSEDPGQKLLFRVHFLGKNLIYATIQLKKAEMAGRNWNHLKLNAKHVFLWFRGALKMLNNDIRITKVHQPFSRYEALKFKSERRKW